MTTRTLYRPVGLRELELVLEADARALPPRLPAQPIFYPVMNAAYAAQIAREWNPTDAASGFSGFVTEHDVDSEYMTGFEVQTVEARQHQELWVPAEDLGTFNAHIRSRIRVTSAFYGPAYEGPAPLPLMVRTRNPREQLKVLHEVLEDKGMDFGFEIAANWKLVVANYGFCSAVSPSGQGVTALEATRTLAAIKDIWDMRHPDLPFPSGAIVTYSEHLFESNRGPAWAFSRGANA